MRLYALAAPLVDDVESDADFDFCDAEIAACADWFDVEPDFDSWDDDELAAEAESWFETIAKDERYWRKHRLLHFWRRHIVPLTFVCRPRVRARAPRPTRRRVRRTLARGRGRPREPEPALAGGAR